MKIFGSLALQGAVLFAVLSQVSFVQASESCDLGGNFRDTVLNSLGKTLALNETSYKLSVVRRDSGAVLCEDSVQADQNIYPASTIKTLVAFAIMRKIDAGQLKLTQEIAIQQANAAVECQDWDCSIYGAGKKLTLQRLLWDMITMSNNLAANQLIDVATKPFINQTADILNAHSVQVVRKVYNIQDPEPTNPLHNSATADGFVQVFREISSGRLKILSETGRAFLVNLLKNQHWNDSLNAKWPNTVTFYHKTGDTSSATADTGFYILGKNDEYAVILIGLQGFAQFQTCANCKTISGYDSLSEIGLSALKLTQRLKGLNL